MENRKRTLFAIFGIVSALAVVILAIALCLVSARHNLAIEKAESEISELNAQMAEKASLLASANDRNRELEGKLESTQEYYLGYYEGLIAQSEAEMKELGENYDRLKEELERNRNKDGIDISELNKLVLSIESLIEKNSPLVRVKRSEEEIKKLKEEDGEAEPSEHKWVSASPYIEQSKKELGKAYSDKLTLSEKLEPTEAEAPDIAIYYEDLITGYKYEYNADKVFDSASVMKAPYITAILDAATKFEAGELEGSKEDEKYSVEALEEMFRLEDTIKLDHESMDVDGSGVLKDAENGEEYTYKELMEYALKNSDNIAFSLIKERFTSKWYFDYVRETDARAPLTNSINMTVSDAGKLFRGIYEFTLENSKYGSFVKESLTDSAHKVLSQSVLGKDIVHKYGWDTNAYHDAAIVYGERPYIAIVFTDLDCGATAADAYIRDIFKKIKELHEFLN